MFQEKRDGLFHMTLGLHARLGSSEGSKSLFDQELHRMQRHKPENTAVYMLDGCGAEPSPLPKWRSRCWLILTTIQCWRDLMWWIAVPHGDLPSQFMTQLIRKLSYLLWDRHTFARSVDFREQVTGQEPNMQQFITWMVVEQTPRRT